MARYIDADKLHELVENRQGRGDCKFCNKYERCVKNGINRKGSHLYCWEEIKLPTADVTAESAIKSFQEAAKNFEGLDGDEAFRLQRSPTQNL